ncbi:glycogen synthase GlgA [Niveibacterium microcysteis]|uniref:Glycogen synthase n=1 Tax=Niveibacterium microcysteis TaxID=2811415 RepID=A0ABX7M8N7_9RHOO|nr:glycogen synthase GlgA [Niveibacterium microcysteis]QSI78068.1 glycogen synthase GlgA [Niveibacterium microcysteis]
MKKKRQPIHVLFASAEIAPWVKTGGLGDVAAALPPALAQAGCKVRVLVPRYPAMAEAFPNAREFVRIPGLAVRLPESRVLDAGEIAPGVTLWLLDCPSRFERAGNPYVDSDGKEWHDNVWRFGLLSRIASWLAENGKDTGWPVDVLHCNDWHTALAPAYQHYLGGDTPSVVTVHNLAFHGQFPESAIGDLGLPRRGFRFDGIEFHGKLSFLKAGLQLCDRITTVSPTYAAEIQTTDYGCGLDGLLRYRKARLQGILNGIDENQWNPATDPLIEACYDADSLDKKAANTVALRRELGLDPGTSPLLGVVSRMGHQKGSDLLVEEGDALVAMGAQVVVLGSGEKPLEAAFEAFATRHPGRVSVTVGYNERLAHRIEAGADIFLMPSRFEPCGLNQMYSLRYGTPPIVRRTGGLADTVVDATAETLKDGSATGFAFDYASGEALLACVRRALDLHRDPLHWRQLQRAGMQRHFGWELAARQYLALYESLLPAAR